jgi:hydrogenase-4 component B
VVLIVSLISGVYGVMNAIGQRDVKKMLAYSSLENIGIIGLGIGLGMLGIAFHSEAVALFGFFGALLHVLNHFAFKSLLFYGAGVVYLKTHTRDIDRLGGLVRALPLTSAFFLIGSLAICGLPLFSGFISEFAIFSGLTRGLSISDAGASVAILGALGGLAFIGAMAVLGFTKVFGIAFLGAPRVPHREPLSEGSMSLLAPMFALTGLILVVGLLAPLAMPLLGPVTRSFVPGGASASWESLVGLYGTMSPALAAFGGLLILFVGLRRLLLKGKPVARFKTWDCGYQAGSPRLQYTGSSFAAPFLRLIEPLVPFRRRVQPPAGLFPGEASFESRGVDIVEAGLVRPLTRLIRRVLGSLAWIQSGQTQSYILYGIVFLVVLIVLVMGVR